MKKNHEIRMKLSKDELDKIKAKAEKLGMSVSQFLRTLGLVSNFTPQTIR